MNPDQSEFLLYTSESGDVKVGVFLDGDTVWLSQKAMCSLFEVGKSTISEHLSNIYKSGELIRNSTVRKIRTVQNEGERAVSRQIDYFNLDVIISIGYRVNSIKATQFRIWATQILKEFMIKGFAIDDQRLKQGTTLFGKDYFDELLERIRDIRASERRFYQKITDIYAQCSIDYDAKSEVTRDFYKTVQNKLHWAITGLTAAELIRERANAQKPNMGLKTWKNAPQGKILKSDTHIAKNYLQEDELKELNRVVTMYLDFAELQAERQNAMKMTDWVTKLDGFLQFNDYRVLKNSGKISASIAKSLADQQYEQFRVVQDQNFESDFDKELRKIMKPGNRKED